MECTNKATDARKINAIAAGLLLFAVSFAAYACSTPVFRYALERWQPDTYEAFVFCHAPLVISDSIKVRQLADAATPPLNANIKVSLVNVNDSIPDQLRQLWTSQHTPETPWLALYSPQSKGHVLIWAGRVSDVPIREIVYSPIRREIANRLLRGESGVWVVVQGSNRNRNRKVAAMLGTTLTTMNDSLIPSILDSTKLGSLPSATRRLLQGIRFSSIIVSRTDPAEKLFIRMLLNGLQADTMSGTAVCILFGRGRNLDILTGKQIATESINQICQFLTGNCSCSIKEANPGVDMLMAVDWNKELTDTSTLQAQMPLLTGMSSMGDNGQTASPVTTPSTQSTAPSFAPRRKPTRSLHAAVRVDSHDIYTSASVKAIPADTTRHLSTLNTIPGAVADTVLRHASSVPPRPTGNMTRIILLAGAVVIAAAGGGSIVLALRRCGRS